MSTKKERAKIAGIYQQAIVFEKDDDHNRFNAGYVWGLHQTLVELGLSVMELNQLHEDAKSWEREFCPDLRSCQAGCSLCGEQFMG